MDTQATHPDDEPAKNTWFYRSLVWRVHAVDEARHIASTQRRHAAEARACIPDVIRNHHQQSVAAGAEQRARNHDEIAAVCERHAARLEAKAHAARRATTAPASPGPAEAACPRMAECAGAGRPKPAK